MATGPVDETVRGALKGGLHAELGFVVDGFDPDTFEITGHVDVATKLLQPFGLVHGGVYAAFAESLASIGTVLGVADGNRAVLGLSNNASFMRPISSGTIHGIGRARHRGRTTWIWDVDFSDDDGRQCATVRVTIAVR